MNGLAIDRLIVVVNAWMRYVRLHLETEDGGRVLASLQGHLAGYKDLFCYLSAEFGLAEFALEDHLDIPTPTCAVEDMDDRDLQQLGLEPDDLMLSALALDIVMLAADPRWENVNGRIMERTEEMKAFLIDRAEKSRDLDVCQGERRGMLIAERLFGAVRNEADHRERERERKRKETPGLFDAAQEGPAEEDGLVDEEPEVSPLEAAAGELGAVTAEERALIAGGSEALPQ